MQDYLLRKDDFKFKNILQKGYVYDNQPTVKSKTVLANGKIKVVYAQYNTLTISIKLGEIDGETMQLYNEMFTDGTYEYWDSDNREYKTDNFIVTKGSKTMISSTHNERYDEYDIVLEKSSEVA